MFEKVPVVGHKSLDGKIDQHYFRKYLDELHKDTSYAFSGHKAYVEKRAKLEQLESSIRSGVKSINGKFVFIGEVLRSIEDDGLFSVVSDGNGNYCKNIGRFRLLHVKNTVGITKLETQCYAIFKYFSINSIYNKVLPDPVTPYTKLTNLSVLSIDSKLFF